MKQSLMNFHELAVNQIKTSQAHNNSSNWWHLANNHDLNNEYNQVHNK